MEGAKKLFLYLGFLDSQIEEKENADNKFVEDFITEWSRIAEWNSKLPDPKKQLFAVYWTGNGVQDLNGKLNIVLERPHLNCIDTMLSVIASYDTASVIVLYDSCRKALPVEFLNMIEQEKRHKGGNVID
jgi:hypothetical protein